MLILWWKLNSPLTCKKFTQNIWEIGFTFRYPNSLLLNRAGPFAKMVRQILIFVLLTPFSSSPTKLENLNIVGDEEYAYNSYYYIDGHLHIIGDNGGCIGVENGTLTVNNCTFTNCKASNSGGAIYVSNSDLLVTNSVFENNIAQSSYDEGGGGIYFNGVNNSISIINNEFDGNIGKYGGAIQINSSNNVNINDNYIYGLDVTGEFISVNRQFIHRYRDSFSGD